MKKYLELMIFLCSSFMGFAQNNLPPVFEIKTDTLDYLLLQDSNRQILGDRTGKLTIDQVSQSPVADRFHANVGALKGVDIYWFRYCIKNAMTHEVGITIPGDGVACTDVYTQHPPGKWDHKLSGNNVPWSKRDGLKREKAIPYTFQPGEKLLVYERRKMDVSQKYLAVYLGYTEKIIQEHYADNDRYVLPSFLFGIFIVAAIFNLFFFLVIHERVYLYFSLAIVFESFARFLGNTDIFFREQPWMISIVGSTCVLAYFFFLIHFVRYFLETFKHTPRWDKWLIGLSIFTSVFLILQMLNIILSAYADMAPALAHIFIVITFILSLKSPDRSIRLRAVIALPAIFMQGAVIVPSVIGMFDTYTGRTKPASILWIFHHFYIIEDALFALLIILFSWTLLLRYQQLQKQITKEAIEKERMAKEKEIERSELIEQQKIILEKTVEERTAELKHSLNELKTTQSQLVHSEKMASLGELTAGIAHEIQNPLNFVNNFSEVNGELIEELQGERSKVRSERDEALEGEIINDIKLNLEKINHHGKRADAIVKGMLQHSKTSAGIKEPTDINKLADEYLRLAYHGMRAKDKSFNAEIKTDFDNTIVKLHIVPQDIGRVLLNLLNNAFYATSEKQKDLTGSSNLPGRQAYVPTVIMVTKKTGDKVEIRVEDNGSGIPQNIIDKIFQPFFTTKPTGQGTGLGLSLAYDIIKAHGGEIKVETKEGEGTEFTVVLPE